MSIVHTRMSVIIHFNEILKLNRLHARTTSDIQLVYSIFYDRTGAALSLFTPSEVVDCFDHIGIAVRYWTYRSLL